jgi:hypothetical protein
MDGDRNLSALVTVPKTSKRARSESIYARRLWTKTKALENRNRQLAGMKSWLDNIKVLIMILKAESTKAERAREREKFLFFTTQSHKRLMLNNACEVMHIRYQAPNCVCECVSFYAAAGWLADWLGIIEKQASE